MDFIARAGGLPSKALRLLGVVSILCVFQLLWTCSVVNTNSQLKTQIENLSVDTRAYAIPSSLQGQVVPRAVDTLLHQFLDHITQNIYTYKYDTLESQYLLVRPFF